MKKCSKIRCFLVVIVTVLVANLGASANVVSAKTYDESGLWLKTVNGKLWIVSVSPYTDDSGNDMIGTVSISVCQRKKPKESQYKGIYFIKNKAYYELKKYDFYGEYKKVGKNKYRVKNKKGNYEFTVSKKYLNLKQKSGKIGGKKIQGKFKLKERFEP